VLPACQDPCVWLVLKLESHVYGKKSTLLKSCLCFCIERLFQPLCAWVPIMERILESRCWEEFGAAFLRRQFTCLRRFCPCISLPHARLQAEEDVSALLLWKESMLPIMERHESVHAWKVWKEIKSCEASSVSPRACCCTGAYPGKVRCYCFLHVTSSRHAPLQDMQLSHLNLL
jgi:hypothetical protein